MHHIYNKVQDGKIFKSLLAVDESQNDFSYNGIRNNAFQKKIEVMLYEKQNYQS